MTDIALELLAAIQKEYKKRIADSEILRQIRGKAKKQTAGYEDADEYAEEISRILIQTCRNRMSEEALPNGTLYYNIAMRVLKPVIQEAYQEAAQMTAQIQETINEKAGYRIKAVAPDLAAKRIDAMIEEILENEEKE